MRTDAGPAARSGRRGLAALLGQGCRRTAGVLLGAGTALLSAGWLLAGGLLLALARPWPAAWPRARRAAAAGLERLVALERRRLARWLDHDALPQHTSRRAVEYLLCRLPLSLLGCYALVSGLFLAFLLLGGGLWAWGAGESQIVNLSTPGLHLSVASSAVGVSGAVLVLSATMAAAALLGAAERRLARWFLGPSGPDLLRRRITELTESRAGVVRAVHEERRRIERDLHDGVQQRLVALAMLLGRARRGTDPARHADLLRQAHVESQQVLGELREIAWRVHPAVLDELGLAAALAGAAERSSVPVRIRDGLTRRPGTDVETAAFFVAREAITNATKHAGASAITVTLTEEADMVIVAITDDGGGGADPAGPGLSGLARRVAALDGRLDVRSPLGGPTVVTAELPCG
ncbi:sensor histidine kinase [Marinitenerispora sediminis]|uniref:histidine kinase n=1 Tax=Marinitenerispora sediminis TaxID=1931232 RepID=A0A368SYI2_9ACTN|nr:histidine kinase [Marinitenerispora sediminis]RCV47630.1 sensor histidine kinase [Marinitenerispora sediminis]RCV47987.1 sensor histidine kinase [Marinitenerispora sediminis]RCV49308.1 sensor histidine kinase [Marinitenerispora sediminis]